MLYPEGTLVSKDTRPRSKKYADKMGIVSLSPVHHVLSDSWGIGRYEAYPIAPVHGSALQLTVSRPKNSRPPPVRFDGGVPR